MVKKHVCFFKTNMNLRFTLFTYTWVTPGLDKFLSCGLKRNIIYVCFVSVALQLHVTVIPREFWIRGPGMEFQEKWLRCQTHIGYDMRHKQLYPIYPHCMLKYFSNRLIYPIRTTIVYIYSLSSSANHTFWIT